jgi:hypothetical protein
MAYDALSFATKVEDGRGALGYFYEVDPAAIYPATQARILEVLGGEEPKEIAPENLQGLPLLDPVVRRYLDQAVAFSDEAWALALQPYADFTEEDDEGNVYVPGHFTGTVAARAQVLQFIESWFNRALLLALGTGARIHYLNDPAYKQ